MNFLSSALFFCAFAVVTVLAENNVTEAITAIIKECETETGGNSKLVEEMAKGVEIHDMNFKCWTACLLQRAGLMNNNGTMNEDDLESLIDAETPKRVELINKLKECMKETGSEKCETGYKVSACILKKEIFPRKPE